MSRPFFCPLSLLNLSLFSPNPPSFCPVPTFFSFFSKKVRRTFGQFGKRSYLCTRFPQGGHKNSIFDRLRTDTRQAARTHII